MENRAESKIVQPRIKMEHFPGIDIAYVNEPDRRLINLFSRGIPENWQRYTLYGSKSILHVDDIFLPKYLAKTKHIVESTKLQRIRSHYQYDSDEVLNNISFISICPELRLTSSVQSSIRDNSLQSLVNDLGYVDFTFVEPIFGVIKRGEKENGKIIKDAKKTFVYPFIAGKNTFSAKQGLYSFRFLELGSSKRENFWYTFRQVMLKNNIVPYDAKVEQLLEQEREDGLHLFLTDIEGYYQKRSRIF